MIRALSFAKVNLYLRVLRKREDGYHDIASLMQKISLADEMTFVPTARDIKLRCPGTDLPENRDNIVYRAAEALFSRVSHPGGVDISLCKTIPVAAGLGGGSSNAATTLMVLNDMLGTPLTRDALLAIGAKLGADVPFFIFTGNAWAFGIGETLQPAEETPKIWFVLIHPDIAVSTQRVYGQLNFRLTNEIIHYSIPRFSTVLDVAHGLRNDLETVTLGLHPELQQIKDVLRIHGALGSLMSGSGPTIYGIFDQESAALKAKDGLAKTGEWDVFMACSV